MQLDETWVRVPIENASESLLGVISGEDKFEFKYFAQLHEIKNSARMWIPVPKPDDYQQVSIIDIKAPRKYCEIEEKKHKNKIFLFSLEPSDSKKVIALVCRVTRLEKSAYASKKEDISEYLKSDSLDPINNNFQNIAKDVIKEKKGELVTAMAIYDHVIEKVQYIKYGDGWGKGDAVYACDIQTENCIDYHVYFTALAIVVGIPARFAIGAVIHLSRDEGGISGYHCWVEFHAEWPCPKKRT